MKNNTSVILPIDSLEPHKILATLPIGSTQRQELMNEDIKLNGQIEPIYVFRNFYLTGRMVISALKYNGIKEVWVNKLPHKTTEEKIMSIVKSKENRRHQSKTQLCCTACLDYQTNKHKKEVNLLSTVKQHETSKTMLANCNFIYENRKDLFDVLFRGLKVKVDGYDTNSIPKVYGMIKDEIKANDSKGEPSDDEKDVKDKTPSELFAELQIENVFDGLMSMFGVSNHDALDLISKAQEAYAIKKGI